MADAGASRADVYLAIKQEILEDLRNTLVKDLQPENFFSYLRSKRVFDEDDCDEINAERTRRKKAELFLDILGKKGQCGFDRFCEAIVERKTQLHLVNRLLDAFEAKIYCNEVDVLPLVQHEHDECMNMELLNQHLPRPGEPGAPCLPSAVTFAHCQDYVPVQTPVVDNDARDFLLNSPPPPYSEH